MFYTAVSILALAAIVGMLLLSYILRGKETPKGMVFTHGPLALVGLILLFVYTTSVQAGPVESVVLFGIAATGGFVLVARDLMRMSVPKWLAISHGVLAVAGFAFLIMYALNK
jgi:hypothetical protein